MTLTTIRHFKRYAPASTKAQLLGGTLDRTLRDWYRRDIPDRAGSSTCRHVETADPYYMKATRLERLTRRLHHGQ